MWGEQIGLATVILHIWPKSKGKANELNWIYFWLHLRWQLMWMHWKAYHRKTSVQNGNGAEHEKRKANWRSLYWHKSNMLYMQIYIEDKTVDTSFELVKVTNRQGRKAVKQTAHIVEMNVRRRKWIEKNLPTYTHTHTTMLLSRFDRSERAHERKQERVRRRDEPLLNHYVC